MGDGKLEWGFDFWQQHIVWKIGSAILCLNKIKMIIWSLLRCLGVLCSGSIVDRIISVYVWILTRMLYYPHVIVLLWHDDWKTFESHLVTGQARSAAPAAYHFSTSMLSLITILDLLILLSFGLALSAIRDLQRRRRCPPGPQPLPIIGNLLNIPKESSWLAYSQFSKKYGEIISFVSYCSGYHWMGGGYSVLPRVRASYYRVELSQGHQGFTRRMQRILLWPSCAPILWDVRTGIWYSQFLTDNVQDGIGLVLTYSKVWWALASRMQGAW